MESSGIPASLVKDLLTEVLKTLESIRLFLQEVACGMARVVINNGHVVEGTAHRRCGEWTTQVSINRVIRSYGSVFD